MEGVAYDAVSGTLHGPPPEELISEWWGNPLLSSKDSSPTRRVHRCARLFCVGGCAYVAAFRMVSVGSLDFCRDLLSGLQGHAWKVLEEMVRTVMRLDAAPRQLAFCEDRA